MASSCNCPITLKERKKKLTNNKQKQNHLRTSVFFTTWMLFNFRYKLHKAQSLKFFFFFLLRNLLLGIDAKNVLLLLLCCYHA